jgi:adenylosuccinate synthase
MTDIKVVVGANFGDEGKGLMTDYFCHQATSKNKSCIVVMSNGGAQRGHTVNLFDGKKHIFKHFGSGTLVGAHTYCPSEFILNPMEFVRELEDLQQLFVSPVVYVEALCRWTTPYDMIINQIAEAARGDKKHGSCGMGIWETVYRWKAQPDLYTIYEFNQLPFDSKVEHLKRIRDNWLPRRLKEHGVSDVPSEWKEIVASDFLIHNFIEDVRIFCTNTRRVVYPILKKYDSVVFESGQGLLLDENMTFYGDNTTPSNTGIFNACKRINTQFDAANVEFCYVTRTYMTRHGAGRFLTECDKASINSSMFDETNITNPFQDNLRYGELNIDNLKLRVENNLLNASGLRFNHTASIAVTHTNEHQFDYSQLKTKIIDGVYTSDSRTRDSVQVFTEF